MAARLGPGGPRRLREFRTAAVLDQLLSTLDVRVQAFAKCEACPGWRLAFGSGGDVSVHYVLSGSGLLHIPELAPIALPRDSFVVLPKGFPHTFDNTAEIGREFIYRPPPRSGRSGVPLIRAGDPVEGRLFDRGMRDAQCILRGKSRPLRSAPLPNRRELS